MSQQEYTAQIRGQIKNANLIDAEATKTAIKALTEAHNDLIRQIAMLPTDAEGKVTYSRYQLEQLKLAVERAMDEFQRIFDQETKAAMGVQFDKGSAQVDGMLKAAIGVQPALMLLPRHNLLIAQNYTAGLVTNLSTSAKTKLNAVLRRSALGGQTVDSIMRQIGKSIGDGEVGKISRRAQTIYRTEVARMGHMAAQARMEEAATRVKGLEHQWVHVGGSLHPRSYHEAIHGMHVPVHETFPGSGPNGEDLLFPTDPIGAVEDTVNCLCDTVAWTPFMEKFAPLLGSKV